MEKITALSLDTGRKMLESLRNDGLSASASNDKTATTIGNNRIALVRAGYGGSSGDTFITLQSGTYKVWNGTVFFFDGDMNYTPADDFCYVIDFNNSLDPTDTQYYLAIEVGPVSAAGLTAGKPLFLVHSRAMYLNDSNGSDFTGWTRGLFVKNPFTFKFGTGGSSTNVFLDCKDAGVSNRGLVNTTQQTWSGEKIFASDIQLGLAAGTIWFGPTRGAGTDNYLNIIGSGDNSGPPYLAATLGQGTTSSTLLELQQGLLTLSSSGLTTLSLLSGIDGPTGISIGRPGARLGAPSGISIDQFTGQYGQDIIGNFYCGGLMVGFGLPSQFVAAVTTALGTGTGNMGGLASGTYP